MLLVVEPNPEPVIVTIAPSVPELGVICVKHGDNVESYVNVDDGNVRPLELKTKHWSQYNVFGWNFFNYLIETDKFPANLSGVRQTICVDVTEIITHDFIPMLTCVFCMVPNPLPLVVKTVPPLILPELGLKDFIVGAPVTTILGDSWIALPTPKF